MIPGYVPTKQQSILEMESNSKPASPAVESPQTPNIGNPAQHNTKKLDSWQDLKIKLNKFQTRTPLFAMALAGSTNTADIINKAAELAAFHKETAKIIAEQLWQGDSIPPSALAVIGKSISRNMQDFWKKNDGVKITPRDAANTFLEFMPEMDLKTEDIFEEEQFVPLPVLKEAAIGSNIFSKLTNTVGKEHPKLQKWFLGDQDIIALASKLTAEAHKKAQDISSAITVHKNMGVQDEKQKEIAYQSTLSTVGYIYETGLQMAFTEIKNEILRLQKATDEEKKAFINDIEKHEDGILQHNTLEKVDQVISAIYMRPVDKMRPSVDEEEDNSPSL